MKLKGFLMRHSKYKIPSRSSSTITVSQKITFYLDSPSPVLYLFPKDYLFNVISFLEASDKSYFAVQTQEGDHLVYLPEVPFLLSEIESGSIEWRNWKFKWQNWYKVRRFLEALKPIADLGNPSSLDISDHLKITFSLPSFVDLSFYQDTTRIFKRDGLYKIIFESLGEPVDPKVCQAVKEIITKISDVEEVWFGKPSIYLSLSSGKSLSIDWESLKSPIKKQVILEILKRVTSKEDSLNIKEKLENLFVLKRLFK